MGSILPSRTRYLIYVDIRGESPNRWIIRQNPVAGSEDVSYDANHRASEIDVRVPCRTFNFKGQTTEAKLFIEVFGKLEWVGTKAVIE